MTDDTVTTQSLDTVGLVDAAVFFGVSVATLRRRIKKGQLPEATKSDGKYGDAYALPIGKVSAIAEREGWTIDLDSLDDQELPTQAPTQAMVPEHLVQQLADAQTTSVQLEQSNRELDRARADLEHERTGHNQTTAHLVEVEKDLATTTGRAEVLQTELVKAQERADSMSEHVATLSARVAAAEIEARRWPLGWRARRAFLKGSDQTG